MIQIIKKTLCFISTVMLFFACKNTAEVAIVSANETVIENKEQALKTKDQEKDTAIDFNKIEVNYVPIEDIEFSAEESFIDSLKQGLIGWQNEGVKYRLLPTKNLPDFVKMLFPEVLFFNEIRYVLPPGSIMNAFFDEEYYHPVADFNKLYKKMQKGNNSYLIERIKSIVYFDEQNVQYPLLNGDYTAINNLKTCNKEFNDSELLFNYVFNVIKNGGEWQYYFSIQNDKVMAWRRCAGDIVSRKIRLNN